MNREIIPAIMPDHFEDIEENVLLVKEHVQTVQLDLMDGKYVPESTWPFNYEIDRDLESIKREELSFPFWEDINYELDLMTTRPEEDLDTWLSLGASRVIFHFASVSNWEKIKSIDSYTRDFINIGLAVTVHDDLEEVYHLIEEGLFDFIQVMGISKIGYQGEPFERGCLEVIKKIKERYPKLTISIDGGVSLESIPLLRDAGADRFVSGSGVYGGGIVDENIRELFSLANNVV